MYAPGEQPCPFPLHGGRICRLHKTMRMSFDLRLLLLIHPLSVPLQERRGERLAVPGIICNDDTAHPRYLSSVQHNKFCVAYFIEYDTQNPYRFIDETQTVCKPGNQQ